MSAIVVRQTVQKIVIDASTGAVSVISTGPQGPAGPAGTNGIFYGDTPPLGPTVGDVWINTTTFTLHTYYNDGDSIQWVEVGSLDVADIDLAALADSLVPYILNDPDFESGVGGGGESTPPTGTISTTTHTLDLADLARLTLFSHADQVTVTVPAATFANGDWFTLQSTGAGGVTFDTTGLTVVNGPLPDLTQFEAITIIFTDANTITYANGSGGGGGSYAPLVHDHDADYAPLVHDHDADYAPLVESYSEVAATGATENIDMNLSFQKMVMDQNCLFDVTNLAAAGEVKTSYVYITGAFTPSFSANFDWGDAGAPTYSDGMMIVLTSMNGVTTVAAAFSGGGFSV